MRTITIRELMLVTLVAGIATAWLVERSRLKSELRSAQEVVHAAVSKVETMKYLYEHGELPPN
jgi:hypothetical protein